MLLSVYEVLLFSFQPVKIDSSLSCLGFPKFNHTGNEDVSWVTHHVLKRAGAVCG